MSQSPVVHNTFVLERVYAASAECVFAAFSDAAKKRRWFAEGSGSSDVEAFEMDFRVGGIERVQYRFREGTPFPGVSLESESVILDIVDGQRIVSASTMAMAGRRFSASLVTAEILAAGGGTKLVLTHQGAFFEGSDGPLLREQGWSELLERLAKELD